MCKIISFMIPMDFLRREARAAKRINYQGKDIMMIFTFSEIDWIN